MRERIFPFLFISVLYCFYIFRFDIFISNIIISLFFYRHYFLSICISFLFTLEKILPKKYNKYLFFSLPLFLPSVFTGQKYTYLHNHKRIHIHSLTNTLLNRFYPRCIFGIPKCKSFIEQEKYMASKKRFVRKI